MNTPYALPEQPPVKRRRTYTVLLIVLLDALLILALIFFFPLLTGSGNRRLTSFDWAGYCVASNLNSPKPSITRINASWTVPTVNVLRGGSFCAA